MSWSSKRARFRLRMDMKTSCAGSSLLLSMLVWTQGAVWVKVCRWASTGPCRSRVMTAPCPCWAPAMVR
ncbi:MAG: hypothetical protein Q8P67_08750 [archaeon]|nr:hypothetical protein [archaeon]